MAAIFNLVVLDGAGAAKTVPVVDASGTGAGPFTWTNSIADGQGISGVAAVKAPSTAPVAADSAMVVALSPNSQSVGIGQVKLWDGTNVAAVKAASASPIAGDPSAVVAISPNSIDFGSGTAGSRTVRVIHDTAQLSNLGIAVQSSSVPVVQAKLTYQTVAASQTASVLGSTGAIGDYTAGVLVVPATTSPGNVLLLDLATSITIFTGGASSVSNLVPFFIPIGAASKNGAWKITTGAAVSVIAVGNFT